MKVTGDRTKLHIFRNFVICTVSQINSGDQIEKNEMGLPCCMYGVEEK